MPDKRAVCVGINNYPGTGSDLSGCVNDARDWAQELTSRGYHVELLLDEEATAAEIIVALQNLMRADAGDTLVFTFSGHGSWLPDRDGDESDQRDEMLCPYDVASGQYLLDDTLAEIFKAKHCDARFFMISDSCHSGTVTRFAFSGLGLSARQSVSRVRYLPPSHFVRDINLLQQIDATPQLSIRAAHEAYPALLLAGCMDREYSYDAWFNDRPNGALTRAAIDALRTNPPTPRKWFAAIRERLPSAEYPQTPQLYGSAQDKKGGMF